MRTFAEINNEQLLVEVIRRLRTTKVLSGGRKAPEGTTFEKVLSTLLQSDLMSHTDIKQVLTKLLESGEILLTGYSRLFVPTQHLPIKRKKGVISKLHPDTKISHWQHFTENGTPIVARHSEGRLVYPDKDKISFWRLKFERLYIVSDGLPASIQAIQKRSPAQPY